MPGSPVDIKQLKFLDALAVEEHFGRAATRCFVTQPTLSLRLRQLEDELGVPLILRGNRYMGFTPEGKRVLSWARRVLDNYEGLYADVAQMRGNLAGQLRLGIVPSALAYAARLTTPFLGKNKEVLAVSLSMSADEIVHGLHDFTIDMGVTYLSRTLPDGMKSMSLYDEGYVALVPENEYFLGKESISWEEAASLPLCLLTEGMFNRQIIEEAFGAVGCEVKPQFESNSILTLYTHVRSGHWATIAPTFHANLIGMPDGVRKLRLHSPEISQPVGLVWRDMQPLSPILEAFHHLVSQTAPALEVEKVNSDD